ncbi:MAG: endonuclease [Granulosicoccus sp.]|nr:endonuclease [Granulosicoccus sp.]
MDFPRLQLAILAGLWLLIWVLVPHAGGFWTSASALLVLAVLVYQCYWIYPYTGLHRREVENRVIRPGDTRPTLRMLNSNVLMTNRNSEPLLSLIRQHQPDIVITLESDQWWQDKLDTLDGYIHRIRCPLDNLYGMHVYSRLPLTESRIDYLVEDDKPSMSALVNLDSDHQIQLHVVHPAPPAPGENDESTERDVELLMLAKALEERNNRIIVAGDLNDVAWSATTRLFRQLSGLLDLRVGRGLFNTFHAEHWYARWPLDHIFVSSHFEVVDIRRLPYIGSDHFPLLVELGMTDDTQSDNAVVEEEVDEERLESILQSSTAENAQAPVVQLDGGQ